jgi:hypothetical protein
MASPPIPPLLDYLANRSFSFYPPILNIEHNEWLFRKATWSEIQVVNRRSGQEIWIARRYVGEVSRIDHPVLIVGLFRELELKDGMVVPFQRRIIEMPIAVGGTAVIEQPAGRRAAPAPVIGIRLERRNHRALKLALILGAALVALYVAVVVLVRAWEVRQKKTAAHPPRERFEADALPLTSWLPRIL